MAVGGRRGYRHRRAPSSYDARQMVYNGEAPLNERRLGQTPALKDYGKIGEELKTENFETVKLPLSDEQSAPLTQEQAEKTADIGNQ